MGERGKMVSCKGFCVGFPISEAELGSQYNPSKFPTTEKNLSLFLSLSHNQNFPNSQLHQPFSLSLSLSLSLSFSSNSPLLHFNLFTSDTLLILLPVHLSDGHDLSSLSQFPHYSDPHHLLLSS